VRATEFMTQEVVTVSADMSVRAATRVLLDREVAALPVVDEAGRLRGIVSELDLLRDRLHADPRAHVRPTEQATGAPPRTVGDVMTRDVVALTEADDEAAFGALLTDTGVKSIPVVRGERLVGIVARRDLLRLLVREDGAVERDVAGLLGAEQATVGRWRVRVRDGAVEVVGAGTARQADEVRLLASTVPGVVRVHVVARGTT